MGSKEGTPGHPVAIYNIRNHIETILQTHSIYSVSGD